MAQRKKTEQSAERIDDLWLDIEELTDDDEQLNTTSIERSQFKQLANRLERYTVAGPTEEQTQHLLQKIRPIMQAARSESDEMSYELEQGQHLWSRFIALLLKQVPLFSWFFWVTSVAVIAIGALLVPFIENSKFSPFHMLIPLVSGFGVFYALRSYRTPMGELEATFAVSPTEIIIGRISIVLLYNIGFAMIASVGLFAFGVTESLHLFIISWLVPLCFCTVLTLLCMLKLGPLAGAIMTLALWGAQMVMGELLGPFHLLSPIHSHYWQISRFIGAALTLIMLGYVFQMLRSKQKGEWSDGDRA